MAKKADKYMAIPYGDDEFGAVLNCAIRYCIGRRTYMPDLVTDWIRRNCKGALNIRTVFAMLRDIAEAGPDGLGAECDVETWRRFEKELIDGVYTDG